MEMERVLFSLHHKCCAFGLRHTTNKARNLAERLLLILAVCGFGALLLAHLSFVYRDGGGGKQLTCLSSIPEFVTTADITHISLSSDNDVSTRSRAWISASAQEECVSDVFYSHSYIKGYLLLPPSICQERGLTVQHVVVSRSDVHCFGEPFLQKLISILGADTVIQNWLLATHNATGFVYNPRTDALIDLSTYHTGNNYVANRQRKTFFNKPLASKLAVACQTCFLYFITTTLTSFTLRETQERMLDFTHRLEAHVRSNQSVVNLVTTHIAENLVFVPGLVGMIFFLIEFYRGDKLLAFFVVSWVWLCEVFSIIRYVHTHVRVSLSLNLFLKSLSLYPSIQLALTARDSLLPKDFLFTLFALSFLPLCLSLWLFLHGLGLDSLFHDT
jgi:hypothetical protein